jgi:Domain of unknown function (DUF4349)
LSPDLATALRAETPSAPAGLRDRVAQIAAVPPPSRRALPVRRVVALGLAAALAASVLGAAVVGLVSSADPTSETAAVERPPTPDADTYLPSRPPDRAARPAPVPAARARVPRTNRASAEALSPGVPLPAPAPLPSAAPGPSATRAQDVQATLTVLVDGTDDLSAETQRALRTTRRLGGYVLVVRYGTPEPTEGTSTLRVRIPVTRVQAAIVQFSGLGRILAQDVVISDLQLPLDELTRRIRRLERRAADAQGAERVRLRREIAALRRQRAELNRRAAFATVELALTTHEPKKDEASPGRLERAIDDASGVLAAELAIGAYALIVASPILLLLAAAFLGTRAYRRYADQRLLERA